MTDSVKNQILAVRGTGKINMFAVNEVQRYAFDHDFYELVCLIEDNPKDYMEFILHGTETAA